MLITPGKLAVWPANEGDGKGHRGQAKLFRTGKGVNFSRKPLARRSSRNAHQKPAESGKVDEGSHGSSKTSLGVFFLPLASLYGVSGLFPAFVFTVPADVM